MNFFPELSQIIYMDYELEDMKEAINFFKSPSEIKSIVKYYNKKNGNSNKKLEPNILHLVNFFKEKIKIIILFQTKEAFLVIIMII